MTKHTTTGADGGELRVTKGGRDLNAWCQKNGISNWRFAKDNGLDRLTVRRIVKGVRWRHVTVDFAKAVEIATNGEVDALDFSSDTAEPVEPASEESDDDASEAA